MALSRLRDLDLMLVGWRNAWTTYLACCKLSKCAQARRLTIAAGVKELLEASLVTHHFACWRWGTIAGFYVGVAASAD